MKEKKWIPVALLTLMLSGCSNTFDRLEQIGKAPEIQPVQNPIQKADYRPVSWPANPDPSRNKTANSLWQPGARTFFRDQRARRVGDILKVIVKINDTANLNDQTTHTRDTQENVKAPNVAGLLGRILPKSANPADLLDITGTNKANAQGQIQRQEQIQTQVAAMVTQILPNGNLVIHGTQEMRVNFELRQITVEGIVRPEDISSDNGITSDQIAEAHISYGGKGQMTDVNQPRVGMQVLDILSPF